MFTRELLDIVLRSVHVIAAIMWIGNSLLFNWLDRNLRPAARPRAGSQGEIWLIHSGGFYEVEKTLTPGERVPQPLHWFKWQAYTTWLSGAALLVLIFYTTGGALLVSPFAGLTNAQAIAIGVGVIVLGVVVYEAIFRSPLARSSALAALLGFALLLATAWALGRVFTGRAAFLHVGALMGTLMAWNVMTKIMPAQRSQVAGVERHEPVDERLSEKAKRHSTHNNYMTFPVVALMLSSHFPTLYAQAWSWVALGVLVSGGAAVRHLLNIRFTYRHWIPALVATAAATLAALYLLGTAGLPRAHGDTPAGTFAGAPSFEAVQLIVHQRCTVCHSAAPAIRTFGVAPGGVSFDRPEQIHALADRIEQRTVATHTMPPGNITWMTEEERALLAAWLRERRR